VIYANLIYENKLNFVKVYKVKDSMNTNDSMQTIHTKMLYMSNLYISEIYQKSLMLYST